MRHTAAVPPVPPRKYPQQRRTGRALLAGAALFLTVGCGDTPPTRPMGARTAIAYPTHASRSKVLLPPLVLPADSDPFTSGDKTSLVEPDPLATTNDALIDPNGPKMPTAHSHWLRGDIFNARVAVRLNGILLGQYSGHIDRDITMKLHEGVNTVTFVYEPLSSEATTHLSLLESEHSTPIPPLAQFQSDAHKSGASGPTTTETVTFLAR